MQKSFPLQTLEDFKNIEEALTQEYWQKSYALMVRNYTPDDLKKILTDDVMMKVTMTTRKSSLLHFQKSQIYKIWQDEIEMDNEDFEISIGIELERGKKRVYARTHIDKVKMTAQMSAPSQSSQEVSQSSLTFETERSKSSQESETECSQTHSEEGDTDVV
ncbi:hypothetical protein DMENIID0001_166020 [Sergentomyia squamirostris]